MTGSYRPCRSWLVRGGCRSGAPLRSPSGFSLLEVLAAIALLSTSLAGLGQLIAMAVRANVSAQATTVASVLASQRMEQLRGDALVLGVGGSLDTDTAGFVDYLDAQGSIVSSGPARGVSFVRRWVVAPLPSDPSRSRVLRVRVVRVLGDAAKVPPWPGVGLDDTRLLTVVTQRER